MATTDTNTPTCTAITKAGTPCTIKRVMPDGMCFYHSPLYAGARRQGASLGGTNRAASKRAMKMMPSKLRPIFERLSKVFEELDKGNYNRQQAIAMATVANVLVKMIKDGELEERMRALEAASHEAMVREGREGTNQWA